MVAEHDLTAAVITNSSPRTRASDAINAVTMTQLCLKREFITTFEHQLISKSFRPQTPVPVRNDTFLGVDTIKEDPHRSRKPFNKTAEPCQKCTHRGFGLTSEGSVSSTRMFGPVVSGPNAQIDRAASRSQSYFVWKNSPSFFLS